MLPKTFYQRELPDSLIAFSSKVGKEIFANSLQEGNMECFFPLIEQFHTQCEPAYCGLGTLVVILNALGVDPNRTWKGPWRWFSEELLNCCKSLEEIQKDGVTIWEFKCLAHCNGAICDVVIADKVTLEEFREDIKKYVKKNDEFIGVSYDRSVLKQTGSGHFSPIGGYNEELDKVLILDVARFKYPPHWCDLKVLYEAMFPKDDVTGLPRGYTKIKRGKKDHFSIFYKIKANPDQFQSFVAWFQDHLSTELSNETFLPDLTKLKVIFDDVFHEYIEIGINEMKLVVDQLYAEIIKTKLYKSFNNEGLDMRHAALYILLFHSIPITKLPEKHQQMINSLREDNLENLQLMASTISFFKNQMKFTKYHCESCETVNKK